MEESSKQVDGLHQTLIDLQYKLQSVRESAVREKADLLRRLAEAETGKLDEKQKFAELLAEVSWAYTTSDIAYTCSYTAYTASCTAYTGSSLAYTVCYIAYTGSCTVQTVLYSLYKWSGIAYTV